jgi:Rad3-related DNA helicases
LQDIPEEFADTDPDNSALGSRAWNQSRGYFLNFLCMNSALIFGQISQKTRTILLASGTLSPMHSYEKELGTLFPNPISTTHVIQPNQVSQTFKIKLGEKERY